MKPFLIGLFIGATLLCPPAFAQLVGNSTPEKAAELYGAITYLLRADETCAILGVPMRAAAELMQGKAREIGGDNVGGLDAMAEKRLAEVRGESPCGNFARDPLLLEASRVVRMEMVVSQLAWDKVVRNNDGECGTFLSVSGNQSPYSNLSTTDRAARDAALVAIITESARQIRAQFSGDPALAKVEQLADDLSIRLDTLACQDSEFSEVIIDYFTLDGAMATLDHDLLVDDSPWSAIVASRLNVSMRDEGVMADGYFVADNRLFAYRNARSNRPHTFAVSQETATWYDSDTAEEVPAARVIFGVLTDNRIAIAIYAYDGVAAALDAMITAGEASFRLAEIGTYDVAYSDGAFPYRLLVLEADDAAKVMEGDTLRISVRHEDGSVGNLKEWDFPKIASLKQAIAFATAPAPR